jgi:hypothetical protein
MDLNHLHVMKVAAGLDIQSNTELYFDPLRNKSHDTGQVAGWLAEWFVRLYPDKTRGQVVALQVSLLPHEAAERLLLSVLALCKPRHCAACMHTFCNFPCPQLPARVTQFTVYKGLHMCRCFTFVETAGQCILGPCMAVSYFRQPLL